jgi:Ca2+-binding RTX toxin-like protein
MIGRTDYQVWLQTSSKPYSEPEKIEIDWGFADEIYGYPGYSTGISLRSEYPHYIDSNSYGDLWANSQEVHLTIYARDDDEPVGFVGGEDIPSITAVSVPVDFEGVNNITGSPVSDNIIGDSTSQEIIGNDGNDLIRASTGDDLILGNKNADTLSGGAGNDTIYGGQNDGAPREDAYGNLKMLDGTEYIYGAAGDDDLLGQFGVDVISGGSGSDVLWGGQGDDSLYGGSGIDYLLGNKDADILSGGSEDDYLDGGSENDDLDGGPGNDILWGGQGSDILSGGSGYDLLIGEQGIDLYVGGDNGDDFAFYDGSGHDYIYDMTYSVDIYERDLIYIQSNINGSGITSETDVLSRISDNAWGEAVIDLGPGNSITILNQKASWFLASDFVIF